MVNGTDSRRLSLVVVGSSTKGALGEVSKEVVELIQSGAGPTALFAFQLDGKAGARTPSKFSEIVPVLHATGVGVGVGVAVGVGVGVGVAVGPGVGVTPQIA